MATILILETEWPTGEVVTTELAVVVENLSDAVKTVEEDLDKNGTEDFKRRVMETFINNRFVHVRNGSTEMGCMYVYLPDTDLE